MKPETILATESPLKIMKNAFYLILKAHFVIKIFKFLYWPFGHVKKGLIKKIRLILKCMTSRPGKQTITIHILPNISRSKGNKTMKFGQLIKHNMTNIFLGKSSTKCSRETIPRLFFKSQNWAYLCTNSLKFYTVCFYCTLSWRLPEYIETKLQATCF